jgi:hypothetical protein
MAHIRPWLFDFARTRPAEAERDGVRYDEGLQISLVEEAGQLVPAILATRARSTKKADIEQGEDIKETWA